MMWNDKILGVITFVYLALFLLHLVYFATKKETILRTAWVLLLITFGFHTLGMVTRWIESYRIGMGHAPLTNFYESLIFYAWCIVLVIIVMKKRLRLPIFTALATAVAVGFMAYASLVPTVDKQIQPLIPALQSNWLHVHVFTCFIAYASFAISFLAGILYLIGLKSIPQEKLEEINYQAIVVGFPTLTAGILTGAVWAHYAWGSYWSWDPKETWSLVTWIIYALFLHARFTKGWKGRRIAFLSIVGFMSVLFTYLGVNFILSGLHSYGAS
jgi:ABC-type transport system involved in cytochrome c biogenesis permease subunit